MYFVLGRLEQPRQDKYLFYLYEELNELNEPTKEGPLLSPHLLSVLTVRRGRPPLSSFSGVNTWHSNNLFIMSWGI
jgi:hypothetical protein